MRTQKWLQTQLSFWLLPICVGVYTFGSYVPSNAFKLMTTLVLLAAAFIPFRVKGLRPMIRFRSVVALLVLWFAVHVASLLSTHDLSNALRIMLLRSPLLILPIAFANKSHTGDEFRDALLVFAVVVLGTTLVSWLWTGYLVVNKEMDPGYLFNDLLMRGSRMQGTYAALHLMVAFWIFCSHIYDRFKFFQWRMSYVLAACLCLFLMLFTASRMVMVVTFLAPVIVLLASFRIPKMPRIAVGVFGVAILVFLLAWQLPQTQRRLSFFSLESMRFDFGAAPELNHFNDAGEKPWNGINTRLAIWSCFPDAMEDHWLMGVGLGNGREAMVESYKANGFLLGERYRFLPHNAFLEQVLQLGLVGAAVFVVIWIVLLLLAFRARSAFVCVLTVGLLLAMCTEDVWNKQHGVRIYALFMSLILMSFRRFRFGFGFPDIERWPLLGNRRSRPFPD